MQTEPIKPFIKWPGGKRWLIPHIKELIRGVKYDRFVEPFCGASALSLAIAPNLRALINDLNPHLINLLRQVQAGKDILKEIVYYYDSDVYYRYRQTFNTLAIYQTERTTLTAALFYYLLKSCFNGLCRFNQQGEFNTPFGRYLSVDYNFDISTYSQAMEKWQITEGDFSEIQLRPTDLVYVDPPYINTFNQFTATTFKKVDQYRLVEWMSSHEGTIITSNSDDPEIEELLLSYNWVVNKIETRRNISANSESRGPVKEILAYRVGSF